MFMPTAFFPVQTDAVNTTLPPDLPMWDCAEQSANLSWFYPALQLLFAVNRFIHIVE